jgi:hypothetical protein
MQYLFLRVFLSVLHCPISPSFTIFTSLSSFYFLFLSLSISMIECTWEIQVKISRRAFSSHESTYARNFPFESDRKARFCNFRTLVRWPGRRPEINDSLLRLSHLARAEECQWVSEWGTCTQQYSASNLSTQDVKWRHRYQVIAACLFEPKEKSYKFGTVMCMSENRRGLGW